MNMENINKAIMAFSQSEKVKVGIIWASQAVNLLHCRAFPYNFPKLIRLGKRRFEGEIFLAEPFALLLQALLP